MNPGQASDDTGQRFALITNDNHSGYLWIASILCLIYSCLVLLTRLHIKWNLYGVDDVAATVATAMQLGEVVPLFLAMNNGLGRSEHLLTGSQLADAGRETFIAQIFLILALALSKASVAALMLRLFTRDIKVTRVSWILCNTVLALTLAWGIGSIIAISVSCSPQAFVSDLDGQCSFPVNRWRVITAFDIFIDLMLVLLPIFFIWPVQMKPYIKAQVVIAFGFRLPVIGFAATHLHYVSSYAEADDVSKAMIPALVYQQFELFWALLSATIPTLKAFMRSFNSGFGMEIDLDGSAYGSRNYYNGSFPLHSLQNATAPNGEVSRPGTKARSDGSGTGGTVGSRRGFGMKEPLREATSVASDGSQELIIQREVKWSVHHEDARVAHK